MSDQLRNISVESDGEERFLVTMQRLFRTSLQAGRDANDGERFDALHSVVVVKGPEALAALTETATAELLAEPRTQSTPDESGANIEPAAPGKPCPEANGNRSRTPRKPAAGRQKRGSKSTGGPARS